MDIERHLLSKVIAEKDLSPLTDSAIGLQQFLMPENRRVYETILRHHGQHGEVPSAEILHMDHPEWRPIKTPDSFPVLIERLRTRFGLAVVDAGLQDAIHAHDAQDLDRAVASLAHVLNTVNASIPRRRVINLSGSGADRLEARMANRGMRGKLLGVPTGFWALDDATKGWRPQQFIVFIGLPKAGKSMLLMHSAIAAHRSGHRPLYVGFEMSNEEQMDRHDALRAGLNPADLATLSITAAELKRLKRVLNEVDNLPDFHLCEDINAASTVSGIYEQIERYDPTAVYIDGIYLMQDEYGEPPNSPQALTNITRGIKRAAQRAQVPIIGVTQALESKTKNGKVTTYSAGYTSSFAQDADDMYGIQATEIEGVISLNRLAGRNGPLFDLFIRRDIAQGLMQELENNPFAFDDALATF